MPTLSDAYLLRQTILLFDIEQRRQLARHGPLTQTRMLLILLRYGTLSQIQLGRIMGLEKSWISRAVDKLVEQGWVLRGSNAQDRRAVELRLTVEGSERARMLRAIMDQHADSVLQRLTPPEHLIVMQAIRLLDGVIEHPPLPAATLTKDSGS